MPRAITVGLVLTLLAGSSPSRALVDEDAVLELFAGLPERFVLEESSETSPLAAVGEPITFRVRSLGPVAGGEAGSVYARATVSVRAMVNAEAAKAEVKRRLAEADPDIGLTYAWDLVTSRDRSVVHLHADCTLSESIFRQVAARLQADTEAEEESFSCRCGGGCRSAAVAPAHSAPVALPRVRPLDEEWEDYDNRLDPSGSWESDIGELSLMHYANGLSFSYLAVFGPAAHICEGAGVAGLVGTDRYEYGDDQGTVAFVISDRAMRMELNEGIASFCGVGWPGESFSIGRHRPPTRCEVRAARSYFHVTDHVEQERRGAYVIRGDEVEAVAVDLSISEEMVLARFVGEQITTVGLLRLEDLACARPLR
jgi:hypothetical protein